MLVVPAVFRRKSSTPRRKVARLICWATVTSTLLGCASKGDGGAALPAEPAPTAGAEATGAGGSASSAATGQADGSRLIFDEAEADAAGGQAVTTAAVDPNCVASSALEMLCDGLDNDCNGKVDDVDLQGDGFCDCLRIGVFGTPGALDSANFNAWLEQQGTTTARLHESADAPELTLDVLQRFDVVVLDWVQRLYTPAEASTLRDWVAQGGAVMAMNGYNDRLPDIVEEHNSLLQGVGLEFAAENLGGPIKDFAAHPLTEGLGLNPNFEGITFVGGRPVQPLVGDFEGVNSTVARTGNGTVVGIAQELGSGRIFVWGDEWVTFDSEWTEIPEIKQFWINAFSWLGPSASCDIPKPILVQAK